MSGRIFGMVTTRASHDYTPYALNSFFACTRFAPEDQFYLIDNDGYLDPAAMERTWPRVRVIMNPAPKSFAANANVIMQLAAPSQSDFFFLNNDVIFTPAWEEPFRVSYAAVMGATGNQNYQYERSGLKLSPVMTLQDYLGHEAVFLELVEEHRRMHSGYVTAYKTNFFCVKVPYSVYSVVGPFDTAFGIAGGEDDDYSVRAYLAGFSVLVAESAYLLHFGGRSSWSGKETLEEWRAREANFVNVFVRKWGPTVARFLLRRDPSVVGSNPRLQEAERTSGIAGLFKAMARMDGIDLNR